MYKLIVRYYGELCDKEKVSDREVYDEEIIESRTKEDLDKVRKEYLSRYLDEGYILDTEEKEIYRLFYGKQENWNNYIEIE